MFLEHTIRMTIRWPQECVQSSCMNYKTQRLYIAFAFFIMFIVHGVHVYKWCPHVHKSLISTCTGESLSLFIANVFLFHFHCTRESLSLFIDVNHCTRESLYTKMIHYTRESLYTRIIIDVNHGTRESLLLFNLLPTSISSLRLHVGI